MIAGIADIARHRRDRKGKTTAEASPVATLFFRYAS